MHGDVPRPFDHHLATVRPRLERQFAERLQLRELSGVIGVREATGPQAVAEAEGDIVLPHDLAQFVEVGVPGILLMMGQHPAPHERPAPAHDAGDALRRHRQIFLQDAGVDGHVIDALLGLMLDHVEHHPRRDVSGVLHVLDHLIDRYGADRHRRRVDDRLADGIDFAAGGEIHDGVGAEMHGGVQLLQFVLRGAGDSGVADVGVDLAQRRDADAHWLQPFCQMIDVGGDNHAAARDFGAHEFRVKVLALGDKAHFIGDDVFAGGFELRHGNFLWRLGFLLSSFSVRVGTRGARLSSLAEPTMVASARLEGLAPREGSRFRILQPR